MTEHTALYRKYRPTTFAEVRDQEHIVSVLEGAIAKHALPHALLFSGGRGTGKTTLARIFASAIGVKGVDVYEIDAASNRGIDDIRALRDGVHTAPYESPYKVYIIDEVHMLTKEAFNALLKTLEEPPAHVIFILATTEEEKLLDTIISRCQVFRFRTPSRAVLASTVIDTAKQEGFTLTPESANLIALAADGSFRDALGVTQKVIIASSGTTADADTVAKIIGAPTNTLLTRLLTALATNNSAEGLVVLDEARARHIDALLFLRIVLEHVRTIMLVRHQPAKTDTLLAPYGEAVQQALKQLALTPGGGINSQLLSRLLLCVDTTRTSPLPFLPFEIILLEIAEAV